LILDYIAWRHVLTSIRDAQAGVTGSPLKNNKGFIKALDQANEHKSLQHSDTDMQLSNASNLCGLKVAKLFCFNPILKWDVPPHNLDLVLVVRGAPEEGLPEERIVLYV